MTSRTIRPDDYRAAEKRARRLRAEGVSEAFRSLWAAYLAAAKRFEAWDATRRPLRRL